MSEEEAQALANSAALAAAIHRLRREAAFGNTLERDLALLVLKTIEDVRSRVLEELTVVIDITDPVVEPSDYHL